MAKAAFGGLKRTGSVRGDGSMTDVPQTTASGGGRVRQAGAMTDEANKVGVGTGPSVQMPSEYRGGGKTPKSHFRPTKSGGVR